MNEVVIYIVVKKETAEVQIQQLLTGLEKWVSEDRKAVNALVYFYPGGLCHNNKKNYKDK